MRDAAEVHDGGDDGETAAGAGRARVQAAQCAVRRRAPGFVLRPGDVGTVLETFGTDEAFLVEFNKNGKARRTQCDWLGVLYPSRDRKWSVPSRLKPRGADDGVAATREDDREQCWRSRTCT